MTPTPDLKLIADMLDAYAYRELSAYRSMNPVHSLSSIEEQARLLRAADEDEARHWAFDAAEALRPVVMQNFFGHMNSMTGREHLLHMLDTMQRDPMSATKACRWLGWIQASLAAHGIVTLDDMKAHNKRFSDEAPRVGTGVVGRFDFSAHLQRQREWSGNTFGPSSRAKGIVAHIRKELKEIEAKPDDVSEWIDVAILALDGAWRTGATPDQIIAALVAKQAKNESRVWPDWRTMPADSAIEHDRSYDSPTIKCDAWSCCGTGRVVGAYDHEGDCQKCNGTGLLPNPKYRAPPTQKGGGNG